MSALCHLYDEVAGRTNAARVLSMGSSSPGYRIGEQQREVRSECDIITRSSHLNYNRKSCAWFYGYRNGISVRHFQMELHKKKRLTKITDDLVKYEYHVIIAESIIEY